jgi:lisH domain-containing protein FOPNL
MTFLDADSQELKIVLKEKLSSSGALESLEGTLRAKLFACICPEPLKSVPTPAKETWLINELIREYLKWNGYVGALAVMNSGKTTSNPQSQMRQKGKWTDLR